MNFIPNKLSYESFKHSVNYSTLKNHKKISNNNVNFFDSDSQHRQKFTSFMVKNNVTPHSNVNWKKSKTFTKLPIKKPINSEFVKMYLKNNLFSTNDNNECSFLPNSIPLKSRKYNRIKYSKKYKKKSHHKSFSNLLREILNDINCPCIFKHSMKVTSLKKKKPPDNLKLKLNEKYSYGINSFSPKLNVLNSNKINNNHYEDDDNKTKIDMTMQKKVEDYKQSFQMVLFFVVEFFLCPS